MTAPLLATNDDESINFTTVLASSIHDMKNSLGIVLNSIDEMVHNLGDTLPAIQLAKLQCEAQQVNDNLVQLLALYKMENQGLAVNIDEYFVRDFLEEMLSSAKAMFKMRNIELDIHCPADLAWYYDRDLIAGALRNAVNNALRYAKTKIRIVAEESHHYLVLSVHDDGKGYSEDIMNNGRTQGHGMDFSSGNTGLGLFFTSRVVELHNNKGRHGAIEFGTSDVLGGARFSIKLP